MKQIQLNSIHVILSAAALMPLIGCRSSQPVAASVVCRPQCALDVPKIVFIATEHDFGKVDAGSQNTCTFEFINDGGKDLLIENIRSSCGCTATNAVDRVIEPGQASEITVTYHAGLFGKTRKEITVFTNDPNNTEVALWVTAEIISPASSAKPETSEPPLTPDANQSPKNTMPRELKQTLRELNKATD